MQLSLSGDVAARKVELRSKMILSKHFKNTRKMIMKNMILPVQMFPPQAGSKDDFTETWFYRIKTVVEIQLKRFPNIVSEILSFGWDISHFRLPPLQICVVFPSKKDVFRRMLVDEPTKKFSKQFFEKNSPARSFCATTRYHPFPELGERAPNVFYMKTIVLFLPQSFVYCLFPK